MQVLFERKLRTNKSELALSESHESNVRRGRDLCAQYEVLLSALSNPDTEAN